MKNHPLCRPPQGAIDVRRLGGNGRWKQDDGSPGLAFFGLVPTASDEEDAAAWVANCNCKVHAECPASRALDKACMIYDGASLVRVRAVAKRKRK